MNKIRTILTFVVLLVAVVSFTACGGGDKAAGSEASLLTMIPADAAGVVTMNFEKIRKLEFFDKMVADLEKKETESEGKAFKSYEDFVKKTGIDLRKDLHAVAFGLFGDFQNAGDDAEFVIVGKITMDRQKILEIIKKEGKEVTSADYKGQELFMAKDDDGKEVGFSFLSDSIITAGRHPQVKRVIDLFKGEGDSILKNAAKKVYLDKMDPGAVMTFVFDFPEKMKAASQQGGPFKMDLSKAEMVFGTIDHAAAAWKGEIKMISKDEAANKNMVTMLNGLKGMGAMAGPEVAELVSNMNLTAAADHIMLSFTLSDELLKKLQEKAAQKKMETGEQD